MMQQILLSYGVGIAGGDYWSLEFRADAYDSSSGAASNGPRVDSSGNVYSAFYFDDSSGNSERLAGLLKTDSQGVLQWARGYSSTSTTVNNYGFDVSSSGTIFHHIRQGNTYIEHQSLATDGTTTSWMKSLGADPNDNIHSEIACRIGASGGHYITGKDVDNIYSYGKLALFKLDGSGGISWARALHGASNQNYITPGRSFGIDSSENTYHCVQHYEHPFGSGTGYKKSSDIAKYNSSGAIQWKKEYKIGSSATNWDVLDLKGVVCDSSGNSYAFGRYVQASLFSGSRGILIKSNSSGTVQWVKQIPKDSDNYGGELDYSGSGIDSSGNLYVNTTGRHNSDRTTVVVHKFNSSGVAQWSRKLYYNAAVVDMSWGFCSVDSNDNLYVTAYATVSSVKRVYLIKVPTDGTGTGDYGNVTWASTTTTSISDVANGSGYATGTSPLTDSSLSQVTATITIPQTNVSPALNNTSYPS
jgi:hypothetical protein